MDIKDIGKTIMFFIVFLVILVFAVAVIKDISNTAEIEQQEVNTTNNSFISNYNIPFTISPTGQGISSLTASHLNDTWLEFDGKINTYINMSDKDEYSPVGN